MTRGDLKLTSLQPCHRTTLSQTESTVYLSTSVETRGILGSKQQESGVSLDDFLCLGHKELPVVIEQPVESLQDVSGGEVQLIQDDPVAFPHGVYQNAWSRGTSNISLMGVQW